MRLFTIGVLALSVTATACGRGQVAAAAGTPADAAVAAATPATSGSGEGAAAKARSVTIPAGTQLSVTLDTSVGSDISRIEQPVVAHLTHPVIVHGDTALAAGSRVGGVVTDATRSGRVKGRAHLGLRFDSVVAAGAASEGARYRIETTAVGRTAESTKKKDALEIGAPAAGGALIGAIAGGKKGALIGTAVGGGAGTAYVMSTRGKEVRMPKGTALTLRLTEPLTVTLR